MRERLKVAAAANHAALNHPDADVLAAFSDRLLPEVDRAIVLEHLGLCVECRDVIALALPGEEQTSAVLSPSLPSPSASRGWLAWPALRWGFVAAGIVIVASLGVVQYGQQTRFAKTRSVPVAPLTMEAQGQTPPASALTGAATKHVGFSTAVSEDKAEQTQGLAKLPRWKAKEASPARVEPFVGRGVAVGIGQGALPHGSVNMQRSQGSQSSYGMQVRARAGTAPPPLAKVRPEEHVAGNPSLPAPSETVEVASAAPVMQAEAGSQEAAAGPRAGPASQPTYDEATVSRSKPAEPPTPDAPQGSVANPPSSPPLNGRSFNQLTSMTPVSSPVWSISAAGGLQRSFDQGQTWLDVDVSESVPAQSKPARKSVGGSISNARAKVPAAGPQIIFRAVAANADDVWAGAAGARLYHSSDAGIHWSRVTPSAQDASLTGDVIRLEFPDSAHGKVTTSTGEIWATPDGGQSWQKQ